MRHRTLPHNASPTFLHAHAHVPLAKPNPLPTTHIHTPDHRPRQNVRTLISHPVGCNKTGNYYCKNSKNYYCKKAKTIAVIRRAYYALVIAVINVVIAVIKRGVYVLKRTILCLWYVVISVISVVIGRLIAVGGTFDPGTCPAHPWHLGGHTSAMLRTVSTGNGCCCLLLHVAPAAIAAAVGATPSIDAGIADEGCCLLLRAAAEDCCCCSWR